MADKEQKAIARLQEAAFYSERLYNGAPLIVTTSGGKDSDVCLTLAQRSGIRFEVMHNHTTADAPETVYHVRETFRGLEEQGIKCAVNMPRYKGQPVTMWSLIPQKLMPPTRAVRYCCDILKERGGAGRMITTGVRAVASVADAYGFGAKRLDLFFRALDENTRDYQRMAEENDEDYANEKLRLKAERVTGTQIRYLYEWEAAQAAGKP